MLKKIFRKIIETKYIRNYLRFLLSKCLPKFLFIKLKRYILHKDNILQLQNNKTKQLEYILRVVPFLNQRKKVDLVICCAFKGRYEILEKSILESFFPRGDHKVEWFLCGSTEEDYQFIQHMAQKTNRVSGMLWRNNPLAEKWQFCVKTAGDFYDATLYAIIGSDDICSSTLIHSIISRHKLKLNEGSSLPAMYCTDKWLVIQKLSEAEFPSAVDCTLKHSEFYVPLGAGRFYTQEFLQRIDFNLYDTKRENCIENFGYFKLLQLGYSIEAYQPEDGLLISVKGNWEQMNSMDDLLNANSIETKDYTFLMLNKLRKDFSPELFSYLFTEKTPKEQYAWTLQ